MNGNLKKEKEKRIQKEETGKKDTKTNGKMTGEKGTEFNLQKEKTWVPFATSR